MDIQDDEGQTDLTNGNDNPVTQDRDGRTALNIGKSGGDMYTEHLFRYIYPCHMFSTNPGGGK